MNKSKLSVVSETNLGVYVWKLPNGGYLMDEDLNVLSIQSFRGDISAMKKLSDSASSYGYPDGAPEFVEGARKIDDEEFVEQAWRLANGLQPDPYDIKVYNENMRRSRK